MKNGLKVLIVASEAAPFIKSGGLGDVVGSLPKALKAQGVDVRVVIPRHMSVKNSEMQDVKYLGEFDVHLFWRIQRAKILVKPQEVPIYFIENDFYFGRGNLYGYGDDNERFAFFGKAVLDMMAMLDFYPDVLHCNDWQTGPICLYLKEIYSKMIYYSRIKTLFTIHNLQYQGNFDKSTMEILGAPYYCYENGNVEFYNNVSYIKMGLTYADRISTVSETYAKEIQTWEYGYGMDGVLRSRKDVLSGIINGIDYKANNPETDNCIVCNYDENHLERKKENKRALQERLGLERRDIPIISMITRLADQKGLDILSHVFHEMMQRDVQFVLLGTGETRFEYFFREMANRYPGRASLNIFFDETLAQQIYAGADMFLMPSRFEPCGLGQMFSLRYGTVPIVRKTGGLADTISQYQPETKEGNGFLFESYDGGGILWALDQALQVYNKGKEEWSHVVRNAMNSNYSWANSASKYIKLYEMLKDEATPKE
ncbi:glycogen synthase GlgA [Anaerotignum sp.]|uniref:glycogen synthase GlgA n=1 Tax=Anaerotignum sp. TaxID=2039241 RepID=UPI0027149E1E|nr:glycogen synthase GlgA [Anaerotignum sp.]